MFLPFMQCSLHFTLLSAGVGTYWECLGQHHLCKLFLRVIYSHADNSSVANLLVLMLTQSSDPCHHNSGGMAARLASSGQDLNTSSLWDIG